jgi:hypothetical protein
LGARFVGSGMGDNRYCSFTQDSKGASLKVGSLAAKWLLLSALTSSATSASSALILSSFELDLFIVAFVEAKSATVPLAASSRWLPAGYAS